MGAVNGPFKLNAKRGIVIASIFLIIVVAADLCGFPIIPRRQRFAEVSTKEGRYFIEGAAVPLAGWYLSLFWKRPNETWVAYQLEHDEPYWFNVKLIEVGDHVNIMKDGTLFGEFIPKKHTLQKHTTEGTVLDFPEPGFAILSDNPLDVENTVNQGSATWSSVWPHYDKSTHGDVR